MGHDLGGGRWPPTMTGPPSRCFPFLMGGPSSPRRLLPQRWPPSTRGTIRETDPGHTNHTQQLSAPPTAAKATGPDQPGHDLGGSGAGAVPLVVVRFQPPPIKPCVRFSRTRLTDVLHRRRSAFPRQSRNGLGAMTAPSRLIRPRWLGDASTWRMPQSQDRRRLPFLDSSNATLRRA
jgi:hypothetical protein